MDFFERWFHFSPDGGDGTLEAACFAAVLVVASAMVIRFALRKAQRGVVAEDVQDPAPRALRGLGSARVVQGAVGLDVEDGARGDLDHRMKGC